MNLNNLIKESYEIAKSKGWHDKPISFADYIANIHAELSEAWEEWRNNRGLDEIYWEYDSIGTLKPCGIPIELADVVIRICDVFGELKITEEDSSYFFHITSNEFGRFITNCHLYVSLSFNNYIINPSRLFELILSIEDFCKENEIDFEKAIELKMAYNKTRPYRHGNKRV